MKSVLLSVLFAVILLFVSCSSAGLVNEEPEGEEYNLYFGDIHSHSAYSNDALMIQLFASQESSGRTRDVSEILNDYLTIAATPVKAIENARNNGLDFVAVTDHAEQIDLPGDKILLQGNDDEWLQLQQVCNSENDDDLVVFIGFEYTKTAATQTTEDATAFLPGGGHKCVIFKGADVPDNPFGADDYNTPEDLWNYLAAYDYFSIPHHTARGKGAEAVSDIKTFSEGFGLQNWVFDEIAMSTDWDYVPSAFGYSHKIMPAVEIFSVHGSSEGEGFADPVEGFDSERSVEAALNRWFTSGYNEDYKLGIVASTDNHLGDPGNTQKDHLDEGKESIVHEEGDYSGGLIAVYAEEKSRGSIFDAIVDKRTYATSGGKIGLEFSAIYNSKKYYMGQTVKMNRGDSLNFSYKAKGDSAAIDYIEVIIVKASGAGGFTKESDIYDASDNIEYSRSVSGVQGNLYVRVTAYQEETTRWHWNEEAGVLEEITTREKAWSSPIWVEVN